jgi:hypothetical protein
LSTIGAFFIYIVFPMPEVDVVCAIAEQPQIIGSRL